MIQKHDVQPRQRASGAIRRVRSVLAEAILYPLACMLLALTVNEGAHSQAAFGQRRLSVETVGGTNGKVAEVKTLPSLATTVLPPTHRDATGMACLTVTPTVRKQMINNSIYDQILLLHNHCGMEIRIRACYYGTKDCSEMSVGGYKRVEKILGIFPSPFFRFSYQEYVQ